MNFISKYLKDASDVIRLLDPQAIEQVVQLLKETRSNGGRLFLVGSGGGAGHASHATCDFRKLCGIEAYCATDNVSELTACVNDEGWEVCTREYLKGSRLNSKDCVFVFSVGGGSIQENISPNLVNAVRYAKECKASIIGIVGRDGGYTAQHANACVIVPTIDTNLVTPLVESFQAVLWHLFASHPELQLKQTKWESKNTSAHSQVNGVHENNGSKPSTKPSTKVLNIKIFADGAEKEGILEMYRNPLISGFTTNPTLMKKSGITDYREFALDILSYVKDRPISFEVFSDDLVEMEQQAREIATWGENVYVKIPITNTRGVSCADLIGRLSSSGIKVNVTAVMTLEQVKEVASKLIYSTPSYISVFAGRVADTGRDPIPAMREILTYLSAYPQVEVIWASPRELLNIVQANDIGCHVITATNDILKKLSLIGKDLKDYSLDTVKMFYNDAKSAGFDLNIRDEEEVHDQFPAVS